MRMAKKEADELAIRDASIIMATCLIWLQVMDFVITYYSVAVFKIAIEINPVINSLIVAYGWMTVAIIKIVAAIIWLVLVRDLAIRYSKTVFVSNVLVVGFYTLLVSWMLFKLPLGF